jgi:hypothetical protein
MLGFGKISSLLAGGKRSPTQVFRAEFDEEYYLTTYGLDKTVIRDPYRHFMETGWREGKNPSPNFDVNFYLLKNRDVQQQGLNPFEHYLKYGKAEGREPRAPLSMINPASVYINYSAEEIEAVRPFFDPDYYLGMYEDVAIAKLDPLHHYMETGWREYRNPSANFNTATYLQINYDVANTGTNPLLHYARNGKHEDRIIKLRCLEEMKVLEERFRKKVVHKNRISVELTPMNIFSEMLKRHANSKLVVALSHDDYLNNVGGIQVFIDEESKKFQRADCLYIHLSPLFNHGNVEPVKQFIRVIANGSLLGVLRTEEVLEMLRNHLLESPEANVLTIHSLINFDINYILDLLSPLTFANRYFWAHDYSLLCAEFNLLRNGIAWCGLPPKDSVACYTCTGCSSRDEKELILQQLLDAGYIIVTPSDAARDVLRKSPLLASAEIQVVNHMRLQHGQQTRQKIIDPEAKIRVAFCGHPVFHKGWGVFEQIVEFSVATGRYEYFHFGVHKTSLHATRFVTVRNSTDSRVDMIDALRENDIDIVVIPAPWAETYCYVAYEALLAGALVLTLDTSGNVSRLAGQHREVRVFPTEHAMIDAFVNGTAYEWARDLFAEGVSTYSSEFLGTTAALEC